jgi:GTP-binding protein
LQFVDEVEIEVMAGDGGRGCVAFRREKYVPRGGPAGGDGGRGGSVVLVADQQLTTLLDFRYQRRHEAARGEHGQGRDCYGAAGADCLLRVPVGTVVTEAESGERLADLDHPGARLVAAQGGRGGRGNLHFATSTNRAPRTAEPGEKGEQRRLRLELKLLADVGLVGFPNSGKSTLLAAVSRARPRIADYPFSTLIPCLGIVGLSGDRSFVLADLPGLIEGAHQGAGLGHRFLRHIERTRALVYLLEVSPDPRRGPLSDLEVLRAELQEHDPGLADRPAIVVLNKADLPEAREQFPVLESELARRGQVAQLVSAATGEGVAGLLERIWELLAHRTPFAPRPAGSSP